MVDGQASGSAAIGITKSRLRYRPPYEVADAYMAWLLPRVRTVGECWIWTQALNNGGYAVGSFRGKTRTVHRMSYEAKHGPIPIGKEVDHVCANPPCVRPQHLQAVTHSENLLLAGTRVSPYRRPYTTIRVTTGTARRLQLEIARRIAETGRTDWTADSLINWMLDATANVRLPKGVDRWASTRVKGRRSQ